MSVHPIVRAGEEQFGLLVRGAERFRLEKIFSKKLGNLRFAALRIDHEDIVHCRIIRKADQGKLMDLIGGQFGHEPLTRGENRLHAVRATRLELTLPGGFQLNLDKEKPWFRYGLRFYPLKQSDQQISGGNSPRTGLGPIVG